MASDDLKLDGVTLTLEECREVLAWADEPWRRIPDVLGDMGDGCLYFGRERLTPERIDRIRDHVMPWTEVRRIEVEPGEHYRTGVLARIAGYGRDGRLLRDWDPVSGLVRKHSGSEFVEVRRPRRPVLTLGDVQPGQRVRSGDSCRAVTACDQHPGDDWRYVLVGPYEVERWPLDTPVELVDE